MRFLTFCAFIGLFLSSGSVARADIAPPLPPAKTAVGIKIEVDENAKASKIIVPNGVFKPPRVRPNFDTPKGELPNESDDGIADAAPRNHLVVAGIAVTLSLAFGGLWFSRRGGRGSARGLALLIAAGATFGAGAIAWANGAPPPFKKNPVPQAFPAAFEGKADIEFVYGQEPVRLILDKASFEKLKKGELVMPAPTPK